MSATVAGEARVPRGRHRWCWRDLALAVIWAVLAALVMLHLMGTFGQLIEEKTQWIDYGRNVTVRDYLVGLSAISIPQALSRLSIWFLLRIAVFAWLSLRLFGPSAAARRPGLALASWLAFDALQLLTVMGIDGRHSPPGLGLLEWARAWPLSSGIDGEMFGEDFLSWAASDLLLAISLRGTVGVGIYWLRHRLFRRAVPAPVV
jgi:hypothetical protein